MADSASDVQSQLGVPESSGSLDGGARGEIPRNETLYINNLNERVPLTQLKAGLQALCADYGPVVDVVARKSLRKRGQAFVIFTSAVDAERALASLQGCEWHAKPLRVAYARQRSDVHAPETERHRRVEKRHAVKQPTMVTAAAKESTPMLTAAKERGEPHNVLFLEGVPERLTPATLQDAFKDHVGFVEARMFAVKHVAFVEFESVEAATAALDRWASDTSAPDVGVMSFAKK